MPQFSASRGHFLRLQRNSDISSSCDIGNLFLLGSRFRSTAYLSVSSTGFAIIGCASSTSAAGAAGVPSAEAKMSKTMKIGYFTDVEGNMDYFERLVTSPGSVLKWRDPATKQDLDFVDDTSYFVHGGDIVDKGIGDIRTCRLLVSLKKRHQDRVHLLVGNRDLNKLRYSAELAEADMGRPIDEIPRVHWDPNAKTLRQHLEALSEKTGETVEKLNTRVERIRYMQQHTLGAGGTFEFRRQEMALLLGKAAADITDEEVLENFIDDIVSPEGALRQYIENGCIAARIGNTLFVHGAIDRQTMKFIPSTTTRFELPSDKLPPAKVADKLDDWVDGMNEFLRAGMKDFAARPDWDAARTTRGGECLLAVQNREAMYGRSVISNCFSDGGCITTEAAKTKCKDAWARAEAEKNPMHYGAVCSDPSDPEVASWLNSNGVRRLVVGHKPSADCPAVLAGSITGLEVVSGDTSFSDVTKPDCRGIAASSVLIVGEEYSNHVEIAGVLKDGTNHFTALPTLGPKGASGQDGDLFVGRPAPGDPEWWVQTKLKDGYGYRLVKGQGRRWEVQVVADVSKPVAADT